ncbi:Polyadenylate-binding protein 8 [Capsicum baccatum]|uniref:Polyadenylate-binding protein 8 n=1 Tax=Capsicum baccatum TaxID=33114 RepID=A0A2G2VFP1_CAPBA|nr:Polyadenylate-binding protein 8 [Capsicum baccatum]
MYLANTTRPDIAFSVNLLARYICAPSRRHRNGIKGWYASRDAAMGQSMPISTLASTLSNATPKKQRTMLGECLYPLVDQLKNEHAVKVTRMLLEMDQTEVLHMLESPEVLKAKVPKAMEVLRNVQQANSPADQLASLSLNDKLVS